MGSTSPIPVRSVRFAYRSGDPRRTAASLKPWVPRLPTGGHYTRDVVFSPDGSKMFVSVGSGSNAGERMGKLDPVMLEGRWNVASIGLGASWGNETDRAGRTGCSIPMAATGASMPPVIRNCVGLAVGPNGDLWCSTNERDSIGDNVPPELHHAGFARALSMAGPWYYIGANEDPRHNGGATPTSRTKVTVPDRPAPSPFGLARAHVL